MLVIYGASDDLVEIEGDVREEIEGRLVTLVIGQPEASPAQDSAGVVVAMRYSIRGVWVAEIGQIAEDILIPWAVRVGVEQRQPDVGGYSARVEIDCPPGTPVWQGGERVGVRGAAALPLTIGLRSPD